MAMIRKERVRGAKLKEGTCGVYERLAEGEQQGGANLIIICHGVFSQRSEHSRQQLLELSAHDSRRRAPDQAPEAQQQRASALKGGCVARLAARSLNALRHPTPWLRLLHSRLS